MDIVKATWVFASISAIAIFLFTLIYPTKILISMLGISILTNSVIIDGSYTALDEMLVLASLTAYATTKLRKDPYREQYLKKSRTILGLIFFSYLLSNSVISYILNRHNSTLRFVLIYAELIIILLLISKNRLRIPAFKKLTTFFSAYLVLWLIYYTVCHFLGVDWQYQQSLTWAGSSYAAYTVAIGGFLHLWHASSFKVNPPYLNSLGYFAGMLLASQIYLSRVLFFCTLVFILVFLILNATRKDLFQISSQALAICLVFFSIMSISNLIVSQNRNLNVQANTSLQVDALVESGQDLNVLANTSLQVDALVESSQFLYKPRESDRDRFLQLKCAFKLTIGSGSAQHILFGYGQDMHKTTLVSCRDIKPLLRPGQEILRPVGGASFLLDFGIVGVILLFSALYASTIGILRKMKSYWVGILLILMSISWSFISNINDNILVYLVLFLIPALLSKSTSDDETKKTE